MPGGGLCERNVADGDVATRYIHNFWPQNKIKSQKYTFCYTVVTPWLARLWSASPKGAERSHIFPDPHSQHHHESHPHRYDHTYRLCTHICKRILIASPRQPVKSTTRRRRPATQTPPLLPLRHCCHPQQPSRQRLLLRRQLRRAAAPRRT